MICAINNYGSIHFKLYEQTMTQQVFIEFLKRLIRGKKRKTFLIVDNLKVHHGKIVAEWLSQNDDKIRMFFIPPYSPELNPDEYLNHALKLSVHSGKQAITKEDIKTKINKFMNSLKANKNKVKAFYGHKNVAYQALCI
jgi:transposase